MKVGDQGAQQIATQARISGKFPFGDSRNRPCEARLADAADAGECRQPNTAEQSRDGRRSASRLTYCISYAGGLPTDALCKPASTITAAVKS